MIIGSCELGHGYRDRPRQAASGRWQSAKLSRAAFDRDWIGPKMEPSGLRRLRATANMQAQASLRKNLMPAATNRANTRLSLHA